jgi:hypothetical protein
LVSIFKQLKKSTVKNFLQLTRKVALAAFAVVAMASCGKKADVQDQPASGTPQTGSFSLASGSGNITGNAFGYASFSNNEFTEVPTLELHLSSATSQLDVTIENPSVAATYNASNVSDIFSVDVTVASAAGQELYTSSGSGNAQIKITSLSATGAKGTISGSLKNINNATAPDLVITNGNFEVNF